MDDLMATRSAPRPFALCMESRGAIHKSLRVVRGSCFRPEDRVPEDHSILYVRIHGVRHERRPRMEEADPERPILDGWYCGDGWCDGRCHLPALTLTRNGTTLRALGSQVACGPAWQPFRRPWVGTTVDVATIYDGDLDAVARIWWL